MVFFVFWVEIHRFFFFFKAIVLAIVKLKVVTITERNILSIMETLAL